MKELIPKYQIDDWAVILDDTWLISLGVDRKDPEKINQINIETNPKYEDYRTSQLIRYRLGGLWFDEEEIKIITKEKNPEYFL